MKLRLRLLRTQALYKRGRIPLTNVKWRGGLYAQRGHGMSRKLTERS